MEDNLNISYKSFCHFYFSKQNSNKARDSIFTTHQSLFLKINFNYLFSISYEKNS